MKTGRAGESRLLSSLMSLFHKYSIQSWAFSQISINFGSSIFSSSFSIFHEGLAFFLPHPSGFFGDSITYWAFYFSKSISCLILKKLIKLDTNKYILPASVDLMYTCS